MKLARSSPLDTTQVREKLLTIDDADSFALCMHTTSALSVRGCRTLPIIDQKKASSGMVLDEAHRLWMMPMKGNQWRATKTGGLPPLDFCSSIRPRCAKPPSLIKVKAVCIPRML